MDARLDEVHTGTPAAGPGGLRLAALTALAIAVAAIGIALGFQYIGGFVPCALCLEQRVPYYIAIPLLIVAAALAGRDRRIARVLLLGAGVALLWSAGLGAYQAGAEWNFWAGPSDCGGGASDVRDASALLSQLAETRLVSCTEASGRVLGLSFAGWNVVAAGTAAAIAIVGALSSLPRRTTAR